MELAVNYLGKMIIEKLKSRAMTLDINDSK
jgi:hypothetical protein